MKNAFITIFIFFNISVCLSQKLNPSLGLIWQDRLFADVTLNIGDSFDTDYSPGGGEKSIHLFAKVAFVGFETDFRETYAPKVGVELSFMVLTGRFSIVSYFQQGDMTIRTLPELGIGLINDFNISYGYGFSLHTNDLMHVSNHRLKFTYFL